MIASYHTTIDKVTERFLGKNKIGTTGRGIGPAYADKIERVGIRIADLFDEKILHEKVEASPRREEPAARQGLQPPRHRGRRGRRGAARPTPSGCGRWWADTSLLLNRALDGGETVLFEGAQATMLDVDHGTYPFVTSSSTRWPAASAPAPASARPASTG